LDYGNGDVIEYTYDAAGNRLTEKVAVPPPPAISVSSSAFDLGSIAQGSMATVSRNVTVGNTGGKLLSWSATTDNFWITFTPLSGTVPAGAPGTPATMTIDPSGLPIGSYAGHVTITDNNASNSPLAVPVTFRITHYADAIPTPYSMSLPGTARKSGSPLSQGDELAAFSVHTKPGVPFKYERTLVGHALVGGDGSFPGLTMYGDDPLTAGVTEGCISGEEIQLALWSASDRKLYTTYVDNATGLPPVLTWSDNAVSLPVDLDFIEGTRIPLRTGAWNLFSDGVLKGWHRGATAPVTPQLDNVAWEPVSTVGDSLPLRSISGKYDRVLGNDGTGATFWNPTLPSISSLSYLAPGYGYWVKMKASSQSLAWMTIPGQLATGAESLALNAGWTLAGYWGNERTYTDNSVSYDATGELLPLTAWEFMTMTSIGDIWASIAGNYVRVTSFDGQGAHLWNPSLPVTRTLRYLGPGYGYWIKMNAPGMLTYPAETR